MPRLPGRLALFVALLSAAPCAAAGDPLPDGALARIGTTRLRHAGSVNNVAFAPDGKSLASCGNDGLVRLWETATGKEIRRFEGDKGSVDAVAFSPDGKTLLSSGTDSTMRFWDVATGHSGLTLCFDPASVNVLAFAADRKSIAGSGRSGIARVWDAAGKLRHVFRGADDPLTTNLAFAPDAAANRAADFAVWGVVDGKNGKAAWAPLALEDAAKASESMARLDQSPAGAVRLLRERLKPVDASEGQRIARLIAQLDDDDFDKREQASHELEKLGARAEGALRKAVQAAASAEVVRRAGDLLRKLEDGAVSGERLREGRALEVLEGLGTPEAKKLLKELAKGAADAALTREAKAALERLAKRP